MALNQRAQKRISADLSESLATEFEEIQFDRKRDSRIFASFREGDDLSEVSSIVEEEWSSRVESYFRKNEIGQSQILEEALFPSPVVIRVDEKLVETAAEEREQARDKPLTEREKLGLVRRFFSEEELSISNTRPETFARPWDSAKNISTGAYLKQLKDGFISAATLVDVPYCEDLETLPDRGLGFEIARRLLNFRSGLSCTVEPAIIDTIFELPTQGVLSQESRSKVTVESVLNAEDQIDLASLSEGSELYQSLLSIVEKDHICVRGVRDDTGEVFECLSFLRPHEKVDQIGLLGIYTEDDETILTSSKRRWSLGNLLSSVLGTDKDSGSIDAMKAAQANVGGRRDNSRLKESHSGFLTAPTDKELESSYTTVVFGGVPEESDTKKLIPTFEIHFRGNENKVVRLQSLDIYRIRQENYPDAE